jgi:hypothetical protein
MPVRRFAPRDQLDPLTATAHTITRMSALYLSSRFSGFGVRLHRDSGSRSTPRAGGHSRSLWPVGNTERPVAGDVTIAAIPLYSVSQPVAVDAYVVAIALFLLWTRAVAKWVRQPPDWRTGCRDIPFVHHKASSDRHGDSNCAVNLADVPTARRYAAQRH